MKKLIVLTMLASFGAALTGCDATTMSAPGNTTLGSAALGGVTGAGIGALAHSKDRGKGALVGGALGAGTGALLGSMAERNRDRQALQEMQVRDAYNRGAADATYGAPPPPPPSAYPPPRSY